jgi:hypothetical protein
MPSYDINLFQQIRNTYPNSNINYVPNIIKQKKSGPKPKDINRDTKIIGKCVSDNCENQFQWSFRKVVEKGPYCTDCSKKRGNERRKETCIEIHGFEYVAQSSKVKQKKEETCEKIYGNKHAIASTLVRTKITETLELKYNGAINPSQIKEVQEKKKQNLIDNDDLVYSLKLLEELLREYGATLNDEINELELVRESPIPFVCNCGVTHIKKFINIRKYGAFCEPCQDIHERKQSIETNMQVRGVPYPSNDPLVVAKMKETNLKNWGTEIPQQLDEVKQKTRDTCQKNLGVDAPMQSPIVQETARINNQLKYNEDHPMHVAEIAERSSKNAYKSYDYVFPSGRIDRIQGYERFALDELLSRGIHEDDIITKRSKVPKVWWYDKNGKKHRYYIDIYVKSLKLGIEVKSTWTAEKKKDKIFLKQNAVKEAGYRCEIWIYDGKGNKVEYHV